MQDTERILSIYPNKSGFSWLVIDDHYGVIDYGRISSKNITSIHENFERLLQDYYINRVVTERFDSDSRRQEKARLLVSEFKKIARRKRIKTASYNTQRIDQVFVPEGSYTKFSRAQIVAELLPPLQRILPRKRKIWESENERMFIFSCAVLTLTHLSIQSDTELRNIEM